MATYTPATISKALAAFGVATIGAATTAAHGIDLSTLDIGQWLTAIGAGLTAGGAVFATPNKSHQSPAEQIAGGLQAALQRQTDADQNKATADAEIDKVKQIATAALGGTVVGSVLGSLASAVDAAL